MAVELKNMLIGFLLMACVFVAFSSFSNETANSYGMTLDNSKLDKYNQELIHNISVGFSSIYNNVTSVTSDNDAPFFTGVWNAVQLGIAAVKSAGASIVVGLSMATNLGLDMEFIPPWATTAVISILTLILAMVIISWILRKDKT